MKLVDGVCPACANRGLQEFYAVDNIPVNSCLIVDSRAEAVAFPRGDLRIALCEHCGFITNTAFELDRLRYDASYEETQSYSPTFDAFEAGLVDRLIRQHALDKEKVVVEIGCGKGTFLSRLCERSGAVGIGIDPTAVPGRLQGLAAERVRFINEFYSEKHSTIDADLICCRHALEHIPDVAGLVRTVRAAASDRKIKIFFELPETLRVLRDGAYWDMYFEHCSYFTPGSLARLFEANGFAVTDLRVEYDDQYLMLEAEPVDVPKRHLFAADRAEDVKRAAELFEREVKSKLEGWRDYFGASRQSGKKIAVWGSGSKCVAFLTTAGVEDDVDYQVVDINPFRHGKFIVGTGKQIAAPDDLKAFGPDEVIVMNPIYRQEIGELVAAMGLDTHIITADTPLEALV